MTTALIDSPAPPGDFIAEAETMPFDRVALGRHLGRHGLGFDPDQPIRQFAGGLANRNYLIRVDGGPAVLRRPPAGELPRGAHDMAREHRILERLSTVLPFVARSLHYCGDPAVIGAPFQIVEYRDGRVLRAADMAGVEHAGGRLSAMLIETLAAIHAVDAAACGLGDLGRPEGFIARAIAGWTSRGLASTGRADLRALIEETGAWLMRRRFHDRAPTLLHLDFKLDNIILDPVTLRPNAVVDWDMGTRGDPLFDLATLLGYWSEPGDPPLLATLDMMPTARPGFWSRRRAMDHYASITGRALDDLHPLRVLAFMKLGVVFLQLHRQWLDGAVKSARYEGFEARARDLLRHARDVARGDAE